MIAMLLFGIIALVLMPFLVSLTKTAIHRCARCLNAVQDNSYFGMSSLEDKLFTWQFGTFGIILTRRTILYTVMIITAALAIYVFILVEETALLKFHNSGITWAGYLRSCGYEIFKVHPMQAKREFH